MPSDDKVLEKIAQILTKAERTDNPHERDTFFAAADALAAKHSIDLALARAHTEGKERSRHRVVAKTVVVGTKGDRGGGTYAELLVDLAEGHDMAWAIRGEKVTLFGTEFDIAYVEKLYPSVLFHMVQDVQKFLDEGEWKGEGVKRLDARFSFCRSFGLVVRRRIKDIRKDAISDAGSGAELVLADQRTEIRKLFRQSVKRSNSTETRRDTSASGRRAGGASARNVRLGGEAGEIGARGAVAE